MTKSPEHRAALSAALLARRAETFWPLVTKTETCWLWTGKTEDGYGRARYGSERLAHRVAYLLTRGAIPEGATLDHLCRVRNCVNPDHLEPVTRQENTRRGAGKGMALYVSATTCRNGHELTPTNLYVHAGVRHCRACRAVHNSRAARRAA